ncbi:hypothetical protein SDC9_71593 [bioreactor metagenome]|uniref:Uncharacterized protein n=1 Tax=bioreactor metagenome TaxID=1076179 RepID=A0A644YEZ1_9ZZZZ
MPNPVLDVVELLFLHDQRLDLPGRLIAVVNAERARAFQQHEHLIRFVMPDIVSRQNFGVSLRLATRQRSRSPLQKIPRGALCPRA